MHNRVRRGTVIAVRAHCLEGLQTPSTPFDSTAEISAKPVRRRWRESDLLRAIAVAKRSKLAHYRIELAPDGTIAIVVGG